MRLAVYGHLYIVSTYCYFSPTHGEQSLKHLVVMRTHSSIMCYFRRYIVRILTGTQEPSNAPTSRNQER
jgi:undecaprenyl pyrophosphate phosphatase UppP